jgi:hypothetical protein
VGAQGFVNAITHAYFCRTQAKMEIPGESDVPEIGRYRRQIIGARRTVGREAIRSQRGFKFGKVRCDCLSLPVC